MVNWFLMGLAMLEEDCLHKSQVHSLNKMGGMFPWLALVSSSLASLFIVHRAWATEFCLYSFQSQNIAMVHLGARVLLSSAHGATSLNILAFISQRWYGDFFFSTEDIWYILGIDISSSKLTLNHVCCKCQEILKSLPLSAALGFTGCSSSLPAGLSL